MAILAIAKLLYIFFMTRRGVAHPWPYDSYLFDPFHRFTDWLIPYRWAEEANPWKANHPLLASLPPSPYGPITFLFLKIGHLFGSLTSFFIGLGLFLFVSFKNFLLAVPGKHGLRVESAIFFFTLILLVFYPIHCIIDRGNTDIIPAIFIATIFLTLLRGMLHAEDRRMDGSYLLIDSMVVLAAGTKPSWIPLVGFVVASGSIARMFRVSVAVGFIYLFPIMFQGVTLADYQASLKSALSILISVSAFSHDFTNGIRPFIETPAFNVAVINKWVLVFGAIYSIGTLAWILVQRRKIGVVRKIYAVDNLILIHILMCTLLFNHPSPDYRLVVLLPAMTALVCILDNLYIMGINTPSESKAYLLSVLLFFSIVASWMGFYTHSGFALSASLRAWLLLAADIAVLIFLAKVVQVDRHSVAEPA